MEWLTTSVILDQMERGDDQAWRLFVERFHAPLIAFARRVGLDQADAEDAAQKTLLTFCEGLREGRYVREKGRLSHWLFGIARHEVLRAAERARQRRSRWLLGEAAEQLLAAQALPEAHFEASWQASLVESALLRIRAEVQPNTFAAFQRVQLQGEEPAAVATALGMTRNAVFVAKHRVLARLRAIVADYEDSEPGLGR